MKSIGSVNEKLLKSNKDNIDLSFILHSIYGLDHYPDYLRRWDLKSIEKLENSLLSIIERVQYQKSLLKKRNDFMSSFVNTLKKPQQISEIFDSKYSNCIINNKFNTNRFLDNIKEEASGVYSFPLLQPSFCEQLRQEMINAQLYLDSYNIKEQSAIQSNIAILDHANLGWLNDTLLELCVSPLSRILFPNETSKKDLDWRHGYVIGYKPNDIDNNNNTSVSHVSRSKLNLHTDDSEVTINICIGSDYFQGGDIEMHGYRGQSHTSTVVTPIKPIIGRAILHAGRQLHKVLPVTSGERHMLIMWTRSLEYTRGGQCPCCWVTDRRRETNREVNNCICDANWN